MRYGYIILLFEFIVNDSTSYTNSWGEYVLYISSDD